MTTLFKKKETKADQKVKAAPRRGLFQKAKAAPPVFIPDGERLPDGKVRYKITCDGGINPSGVYWSKIVPAGASTADYQAAQKERDEKLKELKALTK